MIDVVEILPRGGFDPALAGDRLVLDHDLRLRRRIVFRSQGGAEIRLNQNKTVQLRDGDGLRLADGTILVVEAATEALMEITAHSLPELVRIAWHLGNRHLPAQLLDHALRIREDHVIADMVHHLGGHCRKLSAPFDPEGGAYVGAAGHHGHGHAPHHHHATS